jgi:hypothetical protein
MTRPRSPKEQLMAIPTHDARAAQKRPRNQRPHDLHPRDLGTRHVCMGDEGTDRECPEQKVRKAARTVVGDELDFVFLL